MTDRQAALREALERYLSEPLAIPSREIALVRHTLKRLGHCNTCNGVGLVCSTQKDCKVASHLTYPCPDCVPDEAELLGKMGK